MNSSTELETRVREAWVEKIMRQKWTWVVRLTCGKGDEVTAHKHLGSWAHELRARHRHCALVYGLHTDTPQIHAHALIYMPNQNLKLTPDDLLTYATTLLAWPHGDVNVQHFSPHRIVPGTDHGATHGYANYLTRFVGTVSQIGVAPKYRPRRPRSLRDDVK